jgi:isoleucyl-tRNA synthetase
VTKGTKGVLDEPAFGSTEFNLVSSGKVNVWEILAEFKGKDIEGCSYEQLLPFEANKIDNPNSFKVLLGDFVTTEDGTGIVHTAPAFGADDFRVGKKYDIGILTMVDRQGKFVDGLGEFSNRYVKDYKDEPNYQDVNVDISVKLKKRTVPLKLKNMSTVTRIAGVQINLFCIIR